MSATALRQRALGSGVAIATVITVGHALNDAFGALLIPLSPAISERFGLSLAAVTLLASVFSLTSSVLQPLLGVIGERVDRRLLAAAGPLLTGLGMSLLGYMPGYAALLLLVAVAGLGSGFFHPAGAAYIARHSPQGRRGLWASVFSAGGTAGMALGPLIAGVGLDRLPLFAPLSLAVAAVSYLLTPSDRPQPGVAATPPREYLRVFRGPIVTLWGMAVLRSMASMGYNAMLPFIMIERGFGLTQTALALAIYGLASAAGGLVGGRLSDTHGRTPVLRAAILGTVPLFALLIVSSPANGWFYPLTFVVGAAVNASIPVGVVTAQEYAPRYVALASSIMMGFSWGVAGMLIFLVGALGDVVGPIGAALAAMTLLLPSAYLAWRLPEPQAVNFER